MNPSVDDRISSIIRSLTDIVLPALPREAGLAQEQTFLAIGHLKIIQAQFDATLQFEAEEFADTQALAIALLEQQSAGAATAQAQASLRAALAKPVENPRSARVEINGAICKIIECMAEPASAVYRAFAGKTLLRMQSERVLKDRRWFALMGFDGDIQTST